MVRPVLMRPSREGIVEVDEIPIEMVDALQFRPMPIGQVTGA